MPSVPAPPVTVPVDTGTVTGAVGEVGGVVSGVDPGVLGTVGGTLDGVLAGTLPPPVDPATGAVAPNPLASLLGTLTAKAPAGAPGTVSGPGVVPGTNTIDSRPPLVKVTVLSLLRRTGKTGRVQLSVSSDEPAIVGLSGSVRPGTPRRRVFRAPGFQKTVKVPAAVLAFRQAGALKVTIAVARGVQRRLNRARDARLTLAVIASDAVGNHASARLLRHLKR